MRDAVSQAASADPAALVAAYGFDEGSGTTVTDASGNGNNGTVANGTWSTAGKFGDALSFNGTSTVVTVPNSASLQLSSGMTLEAWVDPTTVSSAWRDVIYKANDNFYMEATSTNASLSDAGLIAGGSYADAFGTSKLTANTWAFLTETYDGSTLRFYVNGTQVASTAHTGAISTSTNPLQIGGDSIYGQFFAGLIDNVRIYNAALTAAQIQTDETTSVNPQGPDTTPPSQPGTLAASAISGSEIDLSWGASTDNVGVAGYDVERCQGASCTTFAQIASGTATTYKDLSVSASTSYSYRVRAFDAAGNVGSDTQTLTITAGPVSYPTASVKSVTALTEPRRAWSDAATIRLREAASSDLLSAFAIAVARSSVNFSRRPSVPAGRSSSVDEMVIAPHRRPSATIGLPTVETVPSRRAATATAPPADDQSIESTRAERPVR